MDSKVESLEVIAKCVQDYFFESGDLHDCRIRRIAWNAQLGHFEILIFDLNANFIGLPEYRGPQPGRLTFEGVRSVHIDVSMSDSGLRIYEALSRIDADLLVVEFRFSPGGKLAVGFETISIETGEAEGLHEVWRDQGAMDS